MATRTPYDQRLARRLVAPLARTPVSPNHVTAVSLALALAGAALLARGTAGAADWGAGLFVLGRFLDHADGELARLKGASSRLGYYFDYAAGGLSYAALFAGIGWGLTATGAGAWVSALGAVGAFIALAAMVINLRVDHARGGDGNTEDYPGVGGFDLEDGIYLLAPVTWAGWLGPFFIAAAAGAVVYGAWVVWRWLGSARRFSQRR